ncbi:MAG: hypothetical protein ACLQHK_06230 [Gallionellaceae bacterium]
MKHAFRLGLPCLLSVGLVACFGGAAGRSFAQTITPPSSVPLGTAIANLSVNGVSANMNISGTINSVPVTGTATIMESPSAAATFNGKPCLSETTAVTGSATGDGQTIPVASTAVGYYNASYATLGVSSSAEYDVAPSPIAYPATVSVSDTAVVGTINRYTDSTMTFPLGTIKESYVVLADPTSSSDLIVGFIEHTYDTANNNTDNSQTYYKVTTSGSISMSSFSTQTSASNVTFTAQ